jgi:hypothetical protein
MRYVSREAQILDFAQASASVMHLENIVKVVRDEYRSAVRAYLRDVNDLLNFSRKDVIDALDDPEFQLATGKLYRELLAAKKELKNAKKRLQTRYLSLPAGFKTSRLQEAV